jgi:hypothetical protein
MGMSAVWALESLWPADVKKSLLTLRFIAITLNKGMNAHAFLKLNLVSGHDLGYVPVTCWKANLEVGHHPEGLNHGYPSLSTSTVSLPSAHLAPTSSRTP